MSKPSIRKDDRGLELEESTVRSDGSCCCESCRLESRTPLKGGAAYFLETGELLKATEGHISVQAAFLPSVREVALEVELDPNIREMISFSAFFLTLGTVEEGELTSKNE